MSFVSSIETTRLSFYTVHILVLLTDIFVAIGCQISKGFVNFMFLRHNGQEFDPCIFTRITQRVFAWKHIFRKLVTYTAFHIY
jgi:hypothetical protein